MIGAVKLLQPQIGLAALQLAAIDLGAVAHDPRDHAQAGRNARAGRIDRHAQSAVEHAGIQFGTAAVHIQKSAGKLSRQKRRAQADHAGKQVVNKGILGAAQGGGIQPGSRQKTVGIAAAGMRGGKDKRHGLTRRSLQTERTGVGGTGIGGKIGHRQLRVVTCLRLHWRDRLARRPKDGERRFAPGVPR